MQTYIVKIYEVYGTNVEVKAENEDDARQKAADKLYIGDVETSKYEHTMERENWTVFKASVGQDAIDWNIPDCDPLGGQV